MRMLTGVDLKVPGHSWIVERANRVAARMGAKVDLLFVMAGTETEKLSVHLESLDRLMGLLEPTQRGRALCVPGSPVDVLVETATDYDTLVVGPREPGAIERILLGSIAARVVRANGKTAVLIPRGEPRPFEENRMLVGVDMGGPNPTRIISYAAQWAGKLGMPLDAVYVAPRMPHIANATVRARAEKEWLGQHERERDQLAALLEEHVDAENRGEALLRHGEPESQLETLSQDYALVCVGSLPRAGLAGLILGSVAEHVVRHAECDVLAIPSNV